MALHSSCATNYVNVSRAINAGSFVLYCAKLFQFICMRGSINEYLAKVE